MKLLSACFLLCSLSLLLPTQGFAEKPVVKLWPNGLPEGAAKLKPSVVAELEKKNAPDRVYHVGEPTLTLYKAPAEQANGCGVVICPGGGYHILAWDHEGIQVAEWLNSFGVTAAVLKYRVPRRSQVNPHEEPLQDSQRAVRMMRQNAKEWNVDPGRVGVLGFSAGGHLTVMTGTQWEKDSYPATDEADKLSARPDFLIPIYAAYQGEAYHGKEGDDTKLSPLVKINKKTPPMFMAVTADDKLRGIHAALVFVELKKAGIPAELHVYVKGGHGYGMRKTGNPVAAWPKLCEEWMKAMGLLKPST